MRTRADAYKLLEASSGCLGDKGDMGNPLKYFAELRDPRVERNRGHLLEAVLLIAIAAVLSRAESWNDIADLSLVERASEWPSLQGLVRIEAERHHTATGKTERETRFYITSLKADAARLNRAIRQHWGIENKLHWTLDVGFNQDRCRKRAGHAAQNFSIFNRIALNLLKQDKSSKRGIKGKRRNAAWNHPYLLKLLGIRYAPSLVGPTVNSEGLLAVCRHARCNQRSEAGQKKGT